MRKIWRGLAPALCLCLLLSGCAALTFQNTNELLRAPALGREEGEIQKALAAAIGEEPQYKFPKEGEWRSPLLMADLNGDGASEGVVLYSVQGSTTGVQDKGSNVYIAILEKREGSWQLTQDQLGLGSEVASMDVADLLANGTTQLIVGFAGANLSNKIFSLYQYNDGLLVEMYRTPYSTYALGDFTGQGGTDLVLVTDQVGALQLLYLPTLNGEFAAPQTGVRLDSNLTYCTGIYPSLGPDGVRLLVIDGLAAGDQIASQLVYFSGEHFYTLDDASRILTESARLNPLLKSRDIDGDGVVEIPLRVGEGEITTMAGDKHLEYVEWKDFTAPEKPTEQFGLLDSDRGIFVRLPDEWRGSINVQDGAGAGEWQIENKDSHRVLLSLENVDANQSLPVGGAIPLPGVSSAHLKLGRGLTAAEREIIQITSLV